jgi:hypothetical protein
MKIATNKRLKFGNTCCFASLLSPVGQIYPSGLAQTTVTCQYLMLESTCRFASLLSPKDKVYPAMQIL